jgi:hypothetical protein
MLWVLLAVSAVLFLYPPVTTLLDVLEAIGNAPAISSAVLETRDRAIMQVLGFVSLYVFLGALLYSYKKPFQQQRIDNSEHQPQPNMRRRSLRIDPLWSFPVGAFFSLAVLVLQGVNGVWNDSDLLYGVALPTLYSIAAGSVAGFATYLIITHID